jgi:hypothetical protein
MRYMFRVYRISQKEVEVQFYVTSVVYTLYKTLFSSRHEYSIIVNLD